MNPKNPSRKLLAINWLALVVLHFTILGSAYLNMGWFNTLFVVTLAIVQMILVILYFMEIRYTGKLTWFFVSAGMFWLLIFITLAMGDYLTRLWH